MAVRTKPVLVSIILAPILTEILSGNTPAHALLHPRIDIFLVVAYSLPLLVIREVSVRWKLSNSGVFLLGLAYGIWNEGLLAQTLMRFSGVPVNKFDHYIYWFGLNFSWSAVILPWHALLAILFPIAIVEAWLSPGAREPWLGKTTLAGITTILITLVLFISIARKPHPQMLISLGTIVILILTSGTFRKRAVLDWKRNERPVLAFTVGFLGYPVFIISAILLAAHHVPATCYFTVVVAELAGFAILCQRIQLLLPPAVAPLAAGAYCAASLFTMAAGFARHSFEHIVTGAAFALVFLVSSALAFSSVRKPARSVPAGVGNR